MATRRYEQRLRAESAEQTRRRILDALRRRLREAPAEPVSLDRIAKIARVARPTVYATFGSRAGLFEAFSADLLRRSGFNQVLEASAHPDAREALRGAIGGVVAMYAANRDEMRVLSSMALLDAAAAGGAVEQMERERAHGMARLAQRLSDQGTLRAGVTVDRATDVLWLLTSFNGFDVLHTGRARSAPDITQILVDTAERSLCRD
ncbi:TetR/AcrR family transcriptional regulator [Allokutzneria sp. A3M-2-11 16]|uniref:TetR/AcrR family transcriptional regulator n=1 Tax=Allokutzneria sp. A3M-2-11 16 TaxID=2962043 RepID=UPI0020B82206|nr:TetR/AcrR family transcriptional regulator [Allokutzneria sp. A3M-2-11 16]MCP3804829.1 TetR/AcrR family transcriptional regulator [Allokutzneria sp. A3M-2-11 16]